MSYNVYYNKQAPTGVLESPQSNLGFTQTPQTNQGISAKQGLGFGVSIMRIAPAAKQVFNTVIKATGNKKIQQFVEGVGTATSIGIELATIGPIGTVAVEGARYLANNISRGIQDIIDQENQAYEIQKQGVANKKYLGVGERID